MKTKMIRHAAVSFLAIMLLMAEVQLTGCETKSADPALESSLQDEVLEKMIGSNWTIQTVTVDGADQTKVYNGLAIKFSPTQFMTTNGGIVWPSSGAWSFNSKDGTIIKRDDGIEVRVEVTDIALKLTLTWMKTTLGGGRVQSVKGVNVFNFVKN